MIRPWLLSVVVVSLLVVAARTEAGKFNKSLSIGDQPAAFVDVVGTDDKKHSLKDYEKAKLVAVVFTCNHCPVAQAYEDRLLALQKEFGGKGLQVIAINVNNNPADKLDKMKERAKSKGYNFPYLYDASQQTGRDYGAVVTPHAFLLDGQRKVAYMGAIDDSQDASKVKQPYLRDAIVAALAGKSLETTETRQFGCGVKYEKK